LRFHFLHGCTGLTAYLLIMQAAIFSSKEISPKIIYGCHTVGSFSGYLRSSMSPGEESLPPTADLLITTRMRGGGVALYVSRFNYHGSNEPVDADTRRKMFDEAPQMASPRRGSSLSQPRVPNVQPLMSNGCTDTFRNKVARGSYERVKRMLHCK